MGPELVLNGLEVVPEHPDNYGILGALVFFSHVKVGGPVQDVGLQGEPPTTTKRHLHGIRGKTGPLKVGLAVT
ncbi:hypothetical protein Y1Q_0023308 [Alligator mississippiensis]|uniref:Uncharacterized protein n=1 Tax=Alligator mississippiensis TaxID=8496 RepID=A0A151NP17_ALLMI|nr:hypothetical protein Y1Q_0023308 [Alligator mississippiensis]